MKSANFGWLELESRLVFPFTKITFNQTNYRTDGKRVRESMKETIKLIELLVMENLVCFFSHYKPGGKSLVRIYGELNFALFL